MNPRLLRICFTIALLFVPSMASAQTVSEPTGVCIALVLPSVQGVEGSATDAAAAVREVFASYLSGPALRSTLLDARLPALAVDEARDKGCQHLLVTTVVFKRGGTSGIAKVLGRAAGTAAVYVPYGSSVGTAAARGAAIAGAQAIASIAEGTRSRDEITLQYKLTAIAANRQLLAKSQKAKASSDGEDLLTPMIEKAAAAIVEATAAK